MKHLPLALPPLPPNELLVAALSAETGLCSRDVAMWLAGDLRVTGHTLEALRRALWRGVHVVRKGAA